MGREYAGREHARGESVGLNIHIENIRNHESQGFSVFENMTAKHRGRLKSSLSPNLNIIKINICKKL